MKISNWCILFSVLFCGMILYTDLRFRYTMEAQYTMEEYNRIFDRAADDALTDQLQEEYWDGSLKIDEEKVQNRFFEQTAYVLDLTGAASHIQNNSAKAGTVQGQVDQFRSNVNGLLDGVENLDAGQIGAKGEAILNQMQSGVDYAVGHPKEMLQYMMNYGLDKAGGAAFGQMVRPLVGRYLANGGQSGDAYLRSYGGTALLQP